MNTAVLQVRRLDAASMDPAIAQVWPCRQPALGDPRAWRGEHSDFWHVHDFEPGSHGQTEVLWVHYRPSDPVLRHLEAHWLTQQAIVPLGSSPLVQVICPSQADGERKPDLGRLQAWWIEPGQGLCMQPGCWHSTFVPHGPVQALMLTRRSTTRDLVRQLEMPTAGRENLRAETGHWQLDAWSAFRLHWQELVSVSP